MVEHCKTGSNFRWLARKHIASQHLAQLTHHIMSDSEEEVAVAAVEAPKAKGKGKRGKVSLTKSVQTACGCSGTLLLPISAVCPVDVLHMPVRAVGATSRQWLARKLLFHSWLAAVWLHGSAWLNQLVLLDILEWKQYPLVNRHYSCTVTLWLCG
jgi:hypothetical protein